jgi:hypothetical protein
MWWWCSSQNHTPQAAGFLPRWCAYRPALTCKAGKAMWNRLSQMRPLHWPVPGHPTSGASSGEDPLSMSHHGRCPHAQSAYKRGRDYIPDRKSKRDSWVRIALITSLFAREIRKLNLRWAKQLPHCSQRAALESMLLLCLQTASILTLQCDKNRCPVETF